MKEKSLFIGSPKYNLVEDFVHHILSGCDIHYGLHCHDEFFKQVFMFLQAISHWEASLHGMELIPCLDLRHGQCHRRTMTNAVEGDLLNMGRDVLEASVDEGATSIDAVRGRIHR